MFLKDKRGYAGLASIVVGTVITSTIALASTEWYLSLNQGLHDLQNASEYMTIFYDQGNRIKNVDYNTLKEQAGTTSTEKAGKYTIEKAISNEGIFQDGKCNTTVSEHQLQVATQRCIESNLAFRDEDGNTIDKIKLTRHSSQMNSAPIGTITVFDGKISDIPEGWHICDGTDGTPDMTDRFIQGTTNESEIGKIAGQNVYKLEHANLPNTNIVVSAENITVVDSGKSTDGHVIPPPPNSGHERVVITCQYGNGGPANYGQTLSIIMNEIDGHLESTSWKGESFETQPPYMKLIYIMRIK